MSAFDTLVWYLPLYALIVSQFLISYPY